MPSVDLVRCGAHDYEPLFGKDMHAMQTLTQNMTRLTTQELLDEVMRRTAADAPALHLLETIVIRARLAESDRRFTDLGTQAEFAPDPEQAGVRGTMEMGLANDKEDVALPTNGRHAPSTNGDHAVSTNGGHEVDADRPGAHTHDHTHRRVSSTKFAAHDHHHLHPDDMKADALLNQHTHARAHARHPWESADPA